MSQFIKFYFTSSILNMYRTLIQPSSGACDFSIVSSHWLRVLVSMCVGVSVWLVWGGILVAACHTDTTPTPHNFYLFKIIFNIIMIGVNTVKTLNNFHAQY